ncbi:MAG: YdcF family protein [Clostridia bacterium]|nr:YdcF family protein [Clostridia bacterium]
MADKHSAGTERFLRAVTDFIFVEDAPEAADIILIPGSRKIEHAQRAAELYRAGYAPCVLPSGRYATTYGCFRGVPERYQADYPETYESEWAFLKAVLMRHGVPEEAILREDQATYTWENALRSREVIASAGLQVRTAILCCHAFHARRALLYYQAAMPGVRMIVCPAQTPGVTRQDWFRTEKGRDRVMGEVARLGSQVREVFEAMLEESAAP